MIGNGLLFNALSARLSSLETRMLALETSMSTRFDLIMGRLLSIRAASQLPFAFP